MKSEIRITNDQINTILGNIGEELDFVEELDGGFVNKIYTIKTKSMLDLILRITNPLPKWTKWKTRNEIEVIKFLRQNTHVPVPTLLDSSDSKKLIGYEYLLMEKAKGIPFHQYYPEVKNQKKCNLISELTSYIEEMQKHHFDLIGCFKDQHTLGKVVDIECGPFATIGDYLQGAILGRARDLHHFPKFKKFIPRLENFANSLKSQEIESRSFVLTHADLEGKNILVENGKISALLDFEWAGSFPDYWDPSSLSNTFQLERFPELKKHYEYIFRECNLDKDISEYLRNIEQIESAAMCLLGYPTWFIGREEEGKKYAISKEKELNSLLKKYGY